MEPMICLGLLVVAACLHICLIYICGVCFGVVLAHSCPAGDIQTFHMLGTTNSSAILHRSTLS
jgi:hypothetical protein